MRWLLPLAFLVGCSKPVVAPTFETPLSIRTSPAMMVAKSTLRITCQLPTDLKAEGTYIFGVPLMFMESGPIDNIQFSREIMGQCEPIHITCGYLIAGETKWHLVSQDMEPVGDCGWAH